MARATGTPLDEATWLRLSPSRGETLRSALERTLKDAIRSGALRAGVALPASRVLAAQLGVSRGVVTDAYAQLEAQGFLRGRRRHPPLVAHIARPAAPPTAASPPPASRPRFDLTPTSPDAALFPAGRWAAAIADATRRTSLANFDYGDVRGLASLREALADHLGRTRGVVSDPAAVLVCQGTAQGLDLVLRVLAARGAHRVAVEDPSLDRQHDAARANGLDLVSWPVDADGVQPGAPDAHAALVTPAHQFPTGAVLSGERRRRLLDWAAQRMAFVLEDDYDAEFRYDRAGIRALQGLDPDRVVYLGSASKTLAPALRLAWMVLPSDLVDEAARLKRLLDGGSPTLDQLALERLIRDGDYDRSVRRARAAYRNRRDRLVEALRRELSECPIEGIAAGLHVLLRLPRDCDDTAVAAAAAAARINVEPLTKYRVDRSRHDPALVVGYGRLGEASIPEAARALAAAVRRPASADALKVGPRTAL
jgi:GntR family transcriptional regulator/MocR family aminotransferase